MIHDSELWYLVSEFPSCTCVDTLSCSHILAVKCKQGMPLKKFTFKPIQLSSLISSRTSGSKSKSQSGFKMKYQNRNSSKAKVVNSEIITNKDYNFSLLMELVNSNAYWTTIIMIFYSPRLDWHKTHVKYPKFFWKKFFILRFLIVD